MHDAWLSHGLMAAAYLLVALLAALNMRHRRAAHGLIRSTRQWRRIAMLMALLAIWQLLGAQDEVDRALRALTRGAGLYDERRLVQVPVLYLALGALYLAFRRWGSSLRRTRAANAWIAAMALAGLTVIRAISLHATDALLSQPIGPLHLHHLLDLALTGTVGACALSVRFSPSRHQHAGPST